MCGAESTMLVSWNALTGTDGHTGLPGRTKRLKINRANCTSLVKIARKPTTVNVTNI